MILSYLNQDWDRPHVLDNTTGARDFLTQEEIDKLPVQYFTLNLAVTQPANEAYIRVEFPVVRLSDRLSAQDHVFFCRHSGMRAFSMGTHPRLGAESVVIMLSGQGEALRDIQSLADSA